MTVELALSDYGIDLRAGQEGPYFPVATLSDIYSDLSYHFALYTNGKVYVEDENKMDSFDDRDEEVITNYMAEDKIPEDLAEFGYGELCFAIGNFFGVPDRLALNDSIKEKGLDRTLEEYGEEGIRIKELLQSTEKGEYLFGLDCLGGLIYDGGHTRLSGSVYEGAMSEPIHEKYLEAKASDLAAEERWGVTENALWMLNGLAVKEVMRAEAYGEDVTYVKKGNTAVCVFDTFWSDYFDETEAYVHGEADALPEDDTMRIFLDALNRAKEDPEVENFVIDVSNNTGGSVDILVTLAALLTGENEIGVPLTNTLTGQTIVDYYQVDANMDGEFNDADKIPCDLRIGVLTAGQSFSAANMFPAVMKSYGAAILGEQSGGGCCAIQCMSTADGLWYRMSSFRMHMTSKDGENIDLGVPVDVDLVEKNADGSDKTISTPIVGLAVEEDGSLNYQKEIEWETPDYTAFFDVDRLGEEMDKFYGKE